MKRILFILLLAGCSSKDSSTTIVVAPPPEPVVEAKAVTRNWVFTQTGDPTRQPKVQMLQLPLVPGGSAIWGAIGREFHGTIYAGVSCESGDGASAHLLALNPANAQMADLGGAMQHLARLSIAKPGESQNKIHTKILQAADGKLYFASMDEASEKDDGSKLPTHGSHLWRLTPGQTEWEHIAACREAIIASAVGGQYVYFLGYFGHVLYQYDTGTGKIASVGVGAIGGHTSRNFLADGRGHVFVPRVSPDTSELIEFDAELREVRAFPLHGYSRTPDETSHGIVATAPLSDGTWLFTTDRGRLYRRANDALVDLGWLHPNGECYAACLFCLDGLSQVVAVGNRGDAGCEWIVFDLKTQQSTAMLLTLPVPAGAKNVLVYGSFTRDDNGRCYVGGRYMLGEKSVPALWAIEP